MVELNYYENLFYICGRLLGSERLSGVETGSWLTYHTYVKPKRTPQAPISQPSNVVRCEKCSWSSGARTKDGRTLGVVVAVKTDRNISTVAFLVLVSGRPTKISPSDH